ncbi:MAG: DM13 domain-containing protein [Acidimicrobiales bacterium]
MRSISPLEWGAAAVAAAVLAVLAIIEPDILGAPFQSGRALVFTVGGTALALAALVAMVRLRVPAPARLLVLGLPFLAVNWWLISPFFIDVVVDDEFEVTIAEASTDTPPTTEAAATPGPDEAGDDAEPEVDATTTTTAPVGPVLIGSGMFVGLAGHDGTGDAGLFALPDGIQVLRFEQFAIDNGPDLKLYLVPGADQTSLADGSINLGDLRGNIGDQTYEIPPGSELSPGAWTVLVWCEAFAVEFVGATIEVA